MLDNLKIGLSSAGPAIDRADKMGLYGWLVGQWSIDAIRHTDDGKSHNASGKIWADWVLEGRAIQDVWSLPDFFYGSTLRVFDPVKEVWHIIWSDPLRQYYTRQIGRAVGQNIIQDGRNEAGELVRWSFSDITGDSFNWTGERSRDESKTWDLQTHILAHRIKV